MRASRSRLIAGAVALLAVGGAAFAAGSFASGHGPAATHKTAAVAQRTFVSAASGNDANPCTRSAPCRNFAAALAQTAAGGEVVVLDSGGYGTFTINQGVSIVAPAGVYAGISVFAGTGITINAGPSDVVTIRGLTLNGLGGDEGIAFNSAAALYVQDSIFKNFANDGISANVGASADLVVEDSLFSRSGTDGLFVQGTAGTFRATIEHSRFEDGFNGIETSANVIAVVRDSVATGNSGGGLTVDPGSRVDVENSFLTHNFYGIDTAGVVRSSQTTIEENTNGIAAFGGGSLISFGNNRLAGNTTNGFFTSTIPLQ